MNVPVNFGCGLYDRMVPLYAGDVKPEGIDLAFEPIDNPRDVFEKMLDGSLDAAEMSFSDFIRRTSAGESQLVAIPAFPSRVFRHSMICVGTGAGITTPKDLEGRRIGVPLYSMTANVWIRGILRQEYGVDFFALRVGAGRSPDGTAGQEQRRRRYDRTERLGEIAYGTARVR